MLARDCPAGWFTTPERVAKAVRAAHLFGAVYVEDAKALETEALVKLPPLCQTCGQPRR